MGKRLVIIGGVAAGTKAAARARRLDPELDIRLFTESSLISYGACGLPYYIGGLIPGREKLIGFSPEAFSKKYSADVQIRHRAIRLDPQSRTVDIQNLETNTIVSVGYDRLMIATGAKPIRPPLPGIDLRRIYTLRTPDDADEIIGCMELPGTRHVVIVGGGLIGLELAENFLRHDLKVTIIEMLNQILPPLDEDFAFLIEQHLRSKGVNILKSDRVKGFDSRDGKDVGTVITENHRLDTDFVMLAIGVRANAGFAEAGGIQLGESGAIMVDPCMRTNQPDIFAAGDCVETTHLVTGRQTYSPLGSVANRQGRVAGTNIARNGNETFPGVAGSVIAKVCDLTAAKTGLNEKEANQHNIPYIRVVIQEKALAGYYPGSQRMWVKILAERDTHRLLGAQIVGGIGVDKRIDVLATALTAGMKFDDLVNLDVSYSPPYSPALDPVNTAGQVFEKFTESSIERLSVMEVNKRIKEKGNEVAILDIREPREKNRMGGVPEAVHIPLQELKERVPHEIAREKMVIVCDQDGRKAASACKLLQNLGYKSCAVLDGGLILWPYELE